MVGYEVMTVNKKENMSAV